MTTNAEAPVGNKIIAGLKEAIAHARGVDRTASVDNIPDAELLKRAVVNARAGRGWHSRWVAVMSTFGLGRTFACQLCVRFDLNPDEQVRRR